MSYFSSFRTCLQCLLFASFFGVFSGAVHAAATQTVPVQAASANDQIVGLLYTSQQTQLESIKERHRQEIETLREELSEASKEIGKFQLALESQKLTLDSVRSETAAVGKRVDDSLIYSGQSLDRFGLWITIILASVGLVGYFSVTRKAVQEAETTAEQWFESRAAQLERKIKHLEEDFERAKARISEHVDDIGNFADEAKAEIQRNGILSAEGNQTLPTETTSLEQRADVLKDVPVSRYQYDDWNVLAHAAYAKGNLEEAAFYWFRCSETPAASDLEVAAALYNRGVVFGEKNQFDVAESCFKTIVQRFANAPEVAATVLYANTLLSLGIRQVQNESVGEALASYNQLIARFHAVPHVSIKELVAKAMVLKADALVTFDNSKKEEAIEIYDEVVREFGSTPELQEPVARALVNKGNAELKLGQEDAALRTYSEVINRFGDFHEHVASAYNGVGFTLLCQGKVDLEVANVEAAREKFNQALAHFDSALAKIKPEKLNGMMMGNRAYVLTLLEQSEAAEKIFESALRAPVFGGEKLYKATLGDFDIHPVSQDTPMKELVERQWKLWQEEQQTEPEESAA